MLDPPVLPSLLGRRTIVFFLRVEPRKNREKATPFWITADEKTSNLQGASAFSLGHLLEALPVQHLRAWKHGFVVQRPSVEMMATSPSDFKESKTLVNAGRILS